ncbi:Rrf2 family transcriptional regulator [Pseudoalteromonas xiamenensis]|uniref:Rrf2 family transcriptional regulator n=1 Tax=Pseudoalteromonas xiamenensis TaxID=882626 RepID=UPI0027E52E21|nr:Rrf2 family transcriptional regulator [Pseudoalteromonas xiamenensis]WMN60683.1 Rrf2 family transcriptional regulator [Pseudoalteromonas xiamenensis]WMN60780.1 Rrf2 family transcriptional regulator [Pseudoalteromonas xiamenensis]
MRKDSRLSRVLHALAHMSHLGRAVTSEEMGKMLNTNPVVVRRTMALLKKAGYITSVKGHNGGWSLIGELSEITLLDIHRALGEPTIFTIGLSDEHTECLIEKAINESLSGVMAEAQSLMLSRFGEITLDLIANITPPSE